MPSRAALLEAIQGSREALEGQIAGVSIDVNLLRADLHKISDKVKGAERNIAVLKTKFKHLKQQVSQMTMANGILTYRVEDADGRSRQNNIRLLGFPERAEGQAT